MPALTPTTTPPELTMAFALPALHTPPVTLAVRIIADPAQTVSDPVMAPATGSEFIVIVLVAEAVPHELVTV